MVVVKELEIVRAYLADNEIEHEETSREGVDGASFSLSLPGEKKLQTPVRLDVGPHALGVHAFVCRNPDENHARVYRWLLERNLRMYAVSFAVDHAGDIYLEARLPLASVSADELDRVLGSVLANADESFNAILELGFASSIRKEWEWRISRGESTRNLEAFRGWLEASSPQAAFGLRRVISTPTIASAPPTKVSDGGTSSMVSQAISVAMPGTRKVVRDSAPASVWVSA